jgi:hypothetical protein
MSLEATLQIKVIKYLRAKGAVVTNIQGNEYTSFVPDLLVCYRGRYVALELKAPNGILSPGQRRKLIKIQKAGGIGEAVYGINKVKDIINSIDSGETWNHSDY